MPFVPVIHVLGSGTCHPVRGGKRRAHPGFFVRWGDGDQHLLIECSQCIAERLEEIGIDPYSIRHLAVSHAHPDHYALPQFVQTAFCSGLSLPRTDTARVASLSIYGSAHIAKSISQLNRIFFEETVDDRGEGGLPSPIIQPKILRASGDVCAFGEGQSGLIAGYRVHHGFGRVDALALRLMLPGGFVLAYSGDTGWCDGLIESARNADLFICEASAGIADEAMAKGYGHLNPRQAGEVARLADVKKLVLTHYSGRDSDEAMLADARSSGYRGEILIAHDGDRYELI